MTPSNRKPLKLTDISSSVEVWIVNVKNTWITGPIFSTTSISSHPMDEHEVSTAPPTPTMAPNAPNLPTRRARNRRDPIQASEEKCAICHLDCGYFTPQSRVEHMNQCWDQLRQRAQEKITLKKNLLKFIEDNKVISEDEKQEYYYSFSALSSSSGSESSSTSSSDRPTSTAAIALRIPRTSCLLCTTSLTDLDAIATFTHRVYCITKHRPYFCPLCSINFLYPVAWDRPEIAWHLHDCHRGGKLTVFDRAAFDQLTDAWSGRMEVLERVIWRGQGGGGRGAAGRYKSKKEDGIWRGDGVYWAGETGLRLQKVMKGGDMELTTCWEAIVPDSVDMGAFRRKAFDVLCLPSNISIPEGWKLVGQTVELGVLETENTGKGEEVYNEEEYDAGIASFGADGSNDMFTAATGEIEPHDEGNTDPSTVAPVIIPPPGFSHPTTTMEILDAILDIVRSRV
jgi:hypothetical protein